MAKPHVSVVMAVYNGERFLRQAVESILRQTFADFEFIVVDDGSSDGTAEILAGYAAGDPRLVVARNAANLGLSRSLNKGMRLARAGYLGRQDADDISAPGRLQAQVDYLDAQPKIGVVGTAADIINANGQPLPPVPGFAEPGDNATIQQGLLLRNPICHGSVLMRRACFEAAGGYDEAGGTAQDYSLWLRLAELTQFAALAPALYQYRQHDQAIGQQRRAEQLAEMARALEAALHRRYPSSPPPDRLLPVALYYLRAAVAYFADGQADLARQACGRAEALDPGLGLFRQHLAELVGEHAGRRPVAEGCQFVEAIFGELLPASPALARVRNRLLSTLHMRRVFQAAGSDAAAVDAHLWPGLRYNPSWLANRGVLSLMVRSLVRAGRGRGVGPKGRRQ